MNASSSRREFLKSAGVGLASAGALAAGLARAQEHVGARFDSSISGEDYWQMVRGQFSFTEDIIPMNAANLCPSFRAVAEEVNLLTADIDRDCSFDNRAKFSGLLDASRNSVAAQLNVSPREVALVRNTSEANNIINAGLSLGRGDEVLLWDQNHPTNNVAWDVRAARHGFTVTKVSTPDAPTGMDELVTAFTDHFSEHTRVLALTYVSNVSGIRLPVAELVQLAHARGIFVHMDGAQVWGAMDLDLRALGVDAFTASAHKWYMGPKEVGLLYVREEHIPDIWPSIVAPGWGDSADTRLEGARKLESFGQRDDAALAALGVTAGIHDAISPARIEQRTVELAQRLKQGMRDIGLELVTPMDPALSFGVCIARAPTGRAGEISRRLYAEAGIAGAATGGVRLCPAIYNTRAHVDRAIDGLRRLMV
jgi:isopenicillin-N epimerase